MYKHRIETWQLHLCIKDFKPEKEKSRLTQRTVCEDVPEDNANELIC